MPRPIPKKKPLPDAGFPALQLLNPPRAPKRPHAISFQNRRWEDPYFWLRERKNPEVLEYLKAENAYTEAVMKDTAFLREKLYQEMLSRIQETDFSVPVRRGDYFYYTRTEKGKQYPVYCRTSSPNVFVGDQQPDSRLKPCGNDKEEEILLDLNELAKGHDYFRLGVFRVSPSQQLLAYSTDATGAEEYTLYVKDLKSGNLLSEKIEKTYSSLEWAADNHTLFYSVMDAAKRPYRLYRHKIGLDPSLDELVFEEKDDAYFLGLYKTKDRQFLVLDLASKISSEIHSLKAGDPLGSFQIIQPREPDFEYSIEHYNGRFLIMTNHQAKNFKLAEAPVASPGRENWKDLIPARPGVKIEGVDVFKDYLVVYERERGLPKIRTMDWASSEVHYLSFDEPVYNAEAGQNPEFESKTLRFEYTSLVTPHSVYDYDLQKRARELKKRQPVLGGYDPSRYASERIFAVSRDGVQVPVSLVYKKGDSPRAEDRPLFLYGYGSYGICVDPDFSSVRLSLLDRGFIFAIAHIRGGGELGRPWYEDGKFLKKKNTFHDFIAAAEHLIREKYTRPEKLAISGGSAGGLLIGAVINMRPDLFKAVIAHVPFVDVVHTMMDPSLPLTVTEYDEWGDPNQKDSFEYIRGYSPYDNIEPKDYPNLLITGGLNDPRVQYWEPSKWTAKLRELKTDRNLLLLKMDMGWGHSGPSGRYDALRDIAFDYAFLFKVFGIQG